MACKIMSDCQYCGKRLTAGIIDFCSDTCLNKEIAKRERLKRALPGEHRCDVCADILTGYGNKKHHTGECTDIAHLKRCKKYQRKHTQPRPMLQKICIECEEPFETTYPEQVVCANQKCKGAFHRKRRRELYQAMPPEQKKEYIEKTRQFDIAEKESYKTKKVKMQAKCPGCGLLHVVKFEIGYIDVVMPRVRCKKWPGCIKHLDNDFATLPSQAGWETGRGARR